MAHNRESSEPTALDAAGSLILKGPSQPLIVDAVPVEDDALSLVSVKQLTGKKVWERHGDRSGSGSASGSADTGDVRAGSTGTGALKKLGRVLAFVFHPTRNTCIGFLVKRPDAALMFRRKDLFVSFSGFDVIDGRIIVGNAAGDKGKNALKAAGVSLDSCVLWQGLPVVCADGTVLGTVGDVLCELNTGNVYELEVSKGAAANALLGTLRASADEIAGFCVCEEAGGSGKSFPAIAVSDMLKERPVEGGVAEKAGSATAVVAHNAKQAFDKVAPKAKEIGAVAGDAVNKGAYITGRQIGRSKGMFKAFKEEFDRALNEDDEED